MDMPPQLGRYRLQQELGRGAMGVVYAGLDTADGRPVAIKTLTQTTPTSTPDACCRDRLRREARALLQLDHPHIVRAHAYGEQHGLAYLVMTRLTGETLKNRLEAGRDFTVDASLRVVADLLDALGHAHRRGVVHRDVKPANLMIGDDGHVTLIDFGVARCRRGDGEDDNPAALLIGTPSYMSPEHIAGQPVGPQADLFAAGIVLYQLLTGQRPFPGSDRAAVQQHILSRHPLPPSQHLPQLAADVDAVVYRALAKHRADRYPDARTFAREVAGLRAARTVPTHAPTQHALAEARAGRFDVMDNTAPVEMAGQQSAFWRDIEAARPPEDLEHYVASFPHDGAASATSPGKNMADQEPRAPALTCAAKRSKVPALACLLRRTQWTGPLSALGCALALILIILFGLD